MPRREMESGLWYTTILQRLRRREMVRGRIFHVPRLRRREMVRGNRSKGRHHVPRLRRREMVRGKRSSQVPRLPKRTTLFFYRELLKGKLWPIPTRFT